MNAELEPVAIKEVEARMIMLRWQYVLLDRDVAELYGFETKRVNEAVRNNPDKFPERYLMRLDKTEIEEGVQRLFEWYRNAV